MLNDHLLPRVHFEAPDDSGALPPDADPGGDAGETSAWAGPSQQEWEQAVGALNYLADLETKRAGVYEKPDQQQQDFDPFDPQSIDARIEAKLGPYNDWQRQQVETEAAERIMDMLGDAKTRGGDFDIKQARDKVDRIAFSLAPRYGGDLWKATEAACQQAADEQRAFEQGLLERGGDIRVNHIKTLAGAPGEPGSTFSVGVQQRTMPDYTQGGRVTDRFFGNSRGE